MIKVGAHVSAAGNLSNSFDKALEIGAEATQIFISPPRQWHQTSHSEEAIQRFKDKQKESKVGPVFIHGTYLVNLGTQNPEQLQKSIEWLKYAMSMAEELEVRGVIFHLGSHKGLGFREVLPQVVGALKIVLEEFQGKAFLILENSAGAGNVLGDKIDELGEILKQVQDDRLKICLDTAHAFGAGYSIHTKAGLDKFLDEFEKEVGLKNLVAIHANDSKVPFSSNKDRHANIGEGFIGLEGFTNLVNHKKFKDVPFILEVPGFEGNGPDLKNVQILKSLAKS